MERPGRARSGDPYPGGIPPGTHQGQEERIDSLYTAICQFAKRQETWFRGMERKGVAVRWIDRGNYDEARAIVEAELL